MLIHALASLTTDGGVGLFLWALWLKQRAERHILFWGLGQMALALGSYVLYCQIHQPWAHALVAASLLMAQIALLYGAAYLLVGRLPQHTVWHLSLSLAATAVVFYLLWWLAPAQILDLTSVLLTSMILLAALYLYVLHHAFRILSSLLLLQGLFNVATAYQLLAFDFPLLLLCAIVIKSAWLLALVNMVLRKNLRQHLRTIDNMECGIAMLSISGRTLEVNRYLLQLLGQPSARQILNVNIREYLHGPVGKEIYLFLARMRAGHLTEVFRSTSTLLRADGTLLPVDVVASAYIDSGETFCTLQLVDVRARVEQEQRAAWAAQHDSLTQLPNRYGMSQLLAQQQARWQSSSAAIAYLIIDIDRFKRVNDLFGYATGDQLIQQIAETLRLQLPAHALLARLDGDEFGMVLTGDDVAILRAQALACAEQICSIFRQNIQLANQSLAISVSIGVAGYPTYGHDLADILRKAEIAMYEAKRRGRAQVCEFDPASMANVTDALVIDSALRAAIPRGELYLVYQPIVSIEDGLPRKIEVLLRWHHPSLGEVSPERFIPVAEESDMIMVLGNWILQQACMQLAQWGACARQLVMSVNVSPRQLSAPDFLEFIDATLARAGLLATQLELEITERVLLDDGLHAGQILHALRQRGIRIALDDFGTGYSAMSYLTHFQFDSLKIDRSFVREMVSDQRMRGMVSSIVDMGKHLDLDLVAEGVETAQQLAELARIGCDYAQGYYISRPLLAQQVFPTLASESLQND